MPLILNINERGETERVETGICPLALEDNVISLSHGGGGRMTQQLLNNVLLPLLGLPNLKDLHDATEVTVSSSRLAITTDSYVVHPIFFAGGDIARIFHRRIAPENRGRPKSLACVFGRPFRLERAIF